MEPLLLLALFGTCTYGLVRAARSVPGVLRRRRERRRQRAAQDLQHNEEQFRRIAETQRQTYIAQRLRLALQQLSQAPDFRRAANWAEHASVLPAALRHRLFREFRQQLSRHYAIRLSRGEDASSLLDSLRDLLVHLGIPAFEADYIKADAERRVTRPTAAQPGYEQRLRELQREHESRMATLRSLPGFDQETREQALEAEVSRYRQTILDLGGERTANP